MDMCPFPIAIMSFNRPDFLSEVLNSLKMQTIGVDESKIFLFQDGARSRFTQLETDETPQSECVARFLDVFPEGKVFRSPVNLGVALNFDRAERLFFEELKVECGLFFEDDLSLSPHYLDALLQLASFAISEPIVSYVAAYGDHTAPLEQQKLYPQKIIRMAHNWGFALTRRQWLGQREFINGYLEIIREKEYALRDVQRIEAYFASFGFAHSAFSQDAAKNVASYVLGTTSLMCFPCFGRNIGCEGTHFSEYLYKEMGYDKTELYNASPPKFDFPDRVELLKWVDQDRETSRKLFAEYAGRPTLEDMLVQTSAIEFVEGLYLSLLGRAADRQGLEVWTRAIKHGKPLADVVQAFVNSREYKSKHLIR